MTIDRIAFVAYTHGMADVSRLAHTIATECAGFRIRQASRLLTRAYDESLRDLGVQGTQLSLLVVIAIFGEEGAPMGKLAEALLMDRTTLTRNVVPLEKAGLLRVARSSEDARARIVLLTRAGERVIESAFPLWEAAQRRVRKALGKKRFDALRSELSEVVRVAKKLGHAEEDGSDLAPRRDLEGAPTRSRRLRVGRGIALDVTW